jgi:enoyl-CoA hydratase/carnithine racemase
MSCEPFDEMSLAERISAGEALLGLILGAAAEHRAIAARIEREARELALQLDELRAAQARALGRLQ